MPSTSVNQQPSRWHPARAVGQYPSTCVSTQARVGATVVAMGRGQIHLSKSSQHGHRYYAEGTLIGVILPSYN